MTSPWKLGLLLIIGLFVGAGILLCIGGLYVAVWLPLTNENIAVNLSTIVFLPIAFIFGMIGALLYWSDWLILAAIVGGLAAPFIFRMTKPFQVVLQTSSPGRLVLGNLFIIVVCGIFSYQRDLTVKEINRRYDEICAAVGKRDHATAYTYMSPGYQKTVSLNTFPQALRKEYGPFRVSFLEECYYSLLYDRERLVAIWGDRSVIAIGDQEFPRIFLIGGTSFYLEKVAGEWYFYDGPVRAGLP